MKPQISFLAMIFSLSVLVYFLTTTISCYPESFPAVPSNLNEIKEIPQNISEYSNPDVLPDPEIDWENVQGFDANISLAQAMKTLDPDARPDWKVAIKAFNCIRHRQTLLAYNPQSSDLDFYDSSRFLVLWFKNGEPTRGTNRLLCVCKGKYIAIVVNRATNQGIGIAYYSTRACYRDEDSVVNTSTN
jgi:hypothetical protein